MESLRAPKLLIALYKGFKNVLPAFNNDPSWTLPMPARYVVAKDGLIAYTEVNPDYTKLTLSLRAAAGPASACASRRRLTPCRHFRAAFEHDRKRDLGYFGMTGDFPPAEPGGGTTDIRSPVPLGGLTVIPGSTFFGGFDRPAPLRQLLVKVVPPDGAIFSGGGAGEFCGATRHGRIFRRCRLRILRLRGGNRKKQCGTDQKTLHFEAFIVVQAPGRRC